ncbi:E3 ubiquitin-protein ligase RNF14-like [Denticeps clupeoides]|uniref:RBR-type E3 ubiquitin transferase n=1 Tax=Denticeps clupeoides TaxID=299321 RepID=A0AAY4DH24_9TELE|nr:E3 ubiquitin-protein ligase RNF14-like [Denticeps clupeoides]XP_028841641.1 E3 ubiquitin-protein ligase RNF14-like [Denticeps clupeoides]
MDPGGAQEDELLALSSICGPDEFVRSGASPAGVFRVRPQLRREFTSVLKKGDRQTEHCLSFLPPVVVTFELPADYPAGSAPVFTLSCLWLSASQLSTVRKHLGELWQDSGGGVVLFSWFQFLREDLLNLLSIDSRLEIHCPELPDDVANNEESHQPQASPITGPTGPLLWQELVRYNEECKQKEFAGHVHDCEICFTQKYGLECHRFTGCGHVFCKECICDLMSIHIKEGRVSMLTCPAVDCTSVVTPLQVKELVGEEMFARYDQFLLQSTIDSMSDVVYCPRKTCSAVVLLDTDDTWALCPSCAFPFCTKCREVYHGVSQCRTRKDSLDEESEEEEEERGSSVSSPENKGGQSKPVVPYVPLPLDLDSRMALWKDYELSSKERKKYLETVYGRIALRKGLADVPKLWLKENVKKCPKCHIRIEKNGGCNFMSCTKCPTHFCWLCLAILDINDHGSSHFKSKKTDCTL